MITLEILNALTINNKILGYELIYDSKRKIKMTLDEIREQLIKGYISVNGIHLDSNNNIISDKECNSIEILKDDIHFKSGNELLKYTDSIKEYQPRKQLKNMIDWYNSTNISNTLALYGLRRTGKTVLLLQLARYLINKGVAVSYLEINKDLNYREVLNRLELEIKSGSSLIILDELTYLEDFLLWGGRITDLYSSNKTKIIVAGTQSFSIHIAKTGIWYDRVNTINTTYISFKEFSRLFSTNDIFDYIRYGGVLSYSKEYINLPEYIYTSISDNIERTLWDYDKYNTWMATRELIVNNKLNTYLQSLIMNCDIQGALKSIRSEYGFKDSNLRSANELLKKHNIVESSLPISILEGMESKYLDMVDLSKIDIDFNKSTMQELIQILLRLDFISYGSIKILGSDSQDEDEKDKILFKQPGLRYSQIVHLLDALVKADIKSNNLKTKLIQDIEGKLLEEVIWETFIELYKDRYWVWQQQFYNIDGEIDLVVMDKDNGNMALIEIKRSSKMDTNQLRWITNDYINKSMIDRYGGIANRIVLYTGEDINTSYNNYSIQYKNISKFLLDSNRE